MADHKVLNEGGESRDNHRYAVVVQDLATQWIQAYPCKTKTSQETQRSLQKFLEPERNPKVIYTDSSLEFGKACEDLSWNHCPSTPHRSETKGIAERAVRRVKEGTSAVLLQSGLNESWWADSMECHTYLRNVTDLLSNGKTPYERRFGQPFKGPIILFGSLVEYHPFTAKDQSRIHQIGKKVLPGLFLGYALQQITKFSVKVVNLETIIEMHSWCRTWPLNGSSRIRVKQKLHMRRWKVCQNSWIRCTDRKVENTGNTIEFGRACEVLSWNHRTSTPHRSETNGIAERAVRRVFRTGWKMEGWFYGMQKAICEMSKTSWQTGKPHKKDGPRIPHGAIVEYHGEIFVKNSSFWQESITRNRSWLWVCRGEILERRFSDKRSGKIWKWWTHRIFLPSKKQRERNLDQTKKWRIRFPICRWYDKIVRKIQEPNLRR